MKRMILIAMIAAFSFALFAATKPASAVTVDFSALAANTMDITTSSYTLGGVMFSYDGSEPSDFASMNSNGVLGTTGGNLNFIFGTPTTRLSFDFSLLNVQEANAPLLDSVILFDDGDPVAVETSSFILTNDLSRLGVASGHFVYNGGSFNQAVTYFSLHATLFSISNVSYVSSEPVQPPFMTIDLIDQSAQLTVTGAPGIVIGIESSTNLVDWERVPTPPNLTGTVIYDVTNFPDVTSEFFRSFF